MILNTVLGILANIKEKIMIDIWEERPTKIHNRDN